MAKKPPSHNVFSILLVLILFGIVATNPPDGNRDVAEDMLKGLGLLPPSGDTNKPLPHPKEESEKDVPNPNEPPQNQQDTDKDHPNLKVPLPNDKPNSGDLSTFSYSNLIN